MSRKPEKEYICPASRKTTNRKQGDLPHRICEKQLILPVHLVPIARSQPQLNPINDLLIGDTNLVGPGVLVRVTPSGTAYVATMVARALTPEVATARMPFEPKPAVLASLPTVSLSSMQLRLFQIPDVFDVIPVSPNLISVSLQNMNLSVSAVGSGRVDDVPVNGVIDIRTNRFQLDVNIEIKRNSRGNPSLKPATHPLQVDLCRVAPNIPVTVSVQNALTPESGARFADAVSRDGHTVFEDLVCPRLIFLVEKRINQRFGLLASRIALGDLNNFDMVKSLLASQQEFRQRSVRRNKMVSRDVPAGQPKRFATQRHARVQRQNRFHTFLNNFNLSRADSLILDYSMMDAPVITPRGIELSTSGEISAPGFRTPFGPRPLSLPPPTASNLLQLAVSDYVPNTLMYHGHRIGLFNTRIDPNTPQFGPVMRTTCDMNTGSLFCVGDLFPTLRDVLPNRAIAFMFSTVKAPAIVVRPPELGGIRFQLMGLIEVSSIDNNGETPIGAMEIHIDASMKMKMTPRAVRGRVNLETIRLITRTPQILVQEELDDAGFLSREILQRMVNDILKQGIPIPVHPLFKLQKPKVINQVHRSIYRLPPSNTDESRSLQLKLSERSMLLETNFQLNEKLIRQLTGEKLA
ncbi:LBP / BPI / CETP family protein [Ancylostoma ceylanicum]|uniref:LBP / BPI / CETP family protein n=1 Tax=Ancylostoma ceylanicum TaxID=53326 RepID=A0A0D6LM61_9BILA|nr:LBP / BPI / CETP family protein [Ancylostoma ceylanicum]